MFSRRFTRNTMENVYNFEIWQSRPVHFPFPPGEPIHRYNTIYCKTITNHSPVLLYRTNRRERLSLMSLNQNIFQLKTTHSYRCILNYLKVLTVFPCHWFDITRLLCFLSIITITFWLNPFGLTGASSTIAANTRPLYTRLG